MQFNDIVNRDLVNLSNCESEPIHIPGSIQPHGFLLGVKGNDFKIYYCSENCKEFIGISHDQLLGKKLNDIFAEAEVEKLSVFIEDIENNESETLFLENNGNGFEVSVNQKEDVYIIEFEPNNFKNDSIQNLFKQTTQFVSLLENTNSLQELCQAIVEQTRGIIGYDRVMVYRFDKDYNGEVFAESVREDLEPFLGLNYPHTDIPAQARELYLKNQLRLIADVDYIPVPIFKLDENTSNVLDLGMSALRSVSPIHIEYLKNMGVGATLTISLIHEQKLWGIIACHHHDTRIISNQTRLAAKLQGSFLTSQIRVREVEEEHHLSVEINNNLEQVLSTVSLLNKENLTELLTESILKITNSQGVAVMVDGSLFLYGKVASSDKIKELIHWLSYFSPSGNFHTSRLIDDYEQAVNLTETTAGIVYNSLGKSTENCVIWFRPEVIQTVNWAGDPNKSMEKTTNGLSPRKSFELWKEIRKNNSVEWRDSELLAASSFAYSLQKQIHLLHLEEQEARYKKMNNELLKTNSELENINWISTHDLKEPLRKIQIFASMILDDEANGLSETINNSINKMSQSALRMQTLVTDIMSYSKIKNREEAFEQVDLNEILHDVENELKDEIAAAEAVIEYEILPSVNGIKFQVNQLLINLIRNSVKFSKESISPVIQIQQEIVSGEEINENVDQDAKFLKISIQDNGIGFSSEFNDSLFEVFNRLHNYNQYKGNGIGLSIARKIMENHGGFIFASGVENVGATFSIYFPIQ